MKSIQSKLYIKANNDYVMNFVQIRNNLDISLIHIIKLKFTFFIWNLINSIFVPNMTFLFYFMRSY